MVAFRFAFPGQLCECCAAQPATLVVDVPGPELLESLTCDACFETVQDAPRED